MRCRVRSAGGSCRGTSRSAGNTPAWTTTRRTPSASTTRSSWWPSTPTTRPRSWTSSSGCGPRRPRDTPSGTPRASRAWRCPCPAPSTRSTESPWRPRPPSRPSDEPGPTAGPRAPAPQRPRARGADRLDRPAARLARGPAGPRRPLRRARALDHRTAALGPGRPGDLRPSDRSVRRPSPHAGGDPRRRPGRAARGGGALAREGRLPAIARRARDLRRARARSARRAPRRAGGLGARRRQGPRAVDRPDVPDVPPRTPRRAPGGRSRDPPRVRAHLRARRPARCRDDGAAGRAVAPPPHARLPLPVALAAQRARLSGNSRHTVQLAGRPDGRPMGGIEQRSVRARPLPLVRVPVPGDRRGVFLAGGLFAHAPLAPVRELCALLQFRGEHCCAVLLAGGLLARAPLAPVRELCTLLQFRGEHLGARKRSGFPTVAG